MRQFRMAKKIIKSPFRERERETKRVLSLHLGWSKGYVHKRYTTYICTRQFWKRIRSIRCKAKCHHFLEETNKSQLRRYYYAFNGFECDCNRALQSVELLRKKFCLFDVLTRPYSHRQSNLKLETPLSKPLSKILTSNG